MLQVQDDTENWKQATIPLTVRPTHLPDHPGQISFPGGRVESGESDLQAATREFEEELGVKPFPGRVIGQLQPIWVYNSDYILTPFVSVFSGPIQYHPCEHEVARLIHFPVTELLSSTTHVSRISRGSVSWDTNVFRYGDDNVWGATGIVLGELAAILRTLPNEKVTTAD
jgi:8-oxo-dGTP pyrophosphatase MutT (NUDIX family)